MKEKLKKIIRKLRENKKVRLIKKSKYFEPRYYSEKYGVNIKAAAKHYLNEGWEKGYNPSRRFSTNGYLKENFAVKICPILDYELYKKENNRKLPKPDIIYEGDYYNYSVSRGFKRIISNITHFPFIIKNHNKKILVCLHLFYYYSFDEIKEYLKNLNCYNYDLIVTIVEECYDEELKEKILKFKKDTKIMVYENRGYDIGSFLDVLNNIDLNKYDMVYKLQSKGIKGGTRFVYGQVFRDREWFINLYEGILGNFNVHKTVDKICNDDNVGVVSAKNLIIEDPIHKQHLVEETVKKMKLEYAQGYKFNAGSCFAIKASLLKDTKDVGLTIKDFDKTRRGALSLAHIMERYIGFQTIKENKIFYGNEVCEKERHKWDKVISELKKYSGLRLLQDDRFIMSDDFVYFFVEGYFVEDYKVTKMKLKDIKRVWNGKVLTLDKCAPYKYLEGNIKEYKEYCDYHQKNNLPFMSKERFDKLIKKLDKEGYNPKYAFVVNDEDDSIFDGQHRACYLMHKYGKNYEVPVVRIKYKYIDLNKINPDSDSIC